MWKSFGFLLFQGCILSYFVGMSILIKQIRRICTAIPHSQFPIPHYCDKFLFPAQDKNHNFIGQHLGDIADITKLPPFTYENLIKRAMTIDVIWFNERIMPSNFYEVEHTTDIKNSLSKFYELQDFHAGFYIVADACRKKEFEDKLNV